MRDIAVVINARIESTRLPNKLVRDFGGTSLIDLALSKMKDIDVNEKYLAAFDKKLLDKAVLHGIPVLARTKESVAKGQVPHKIAFQHFNNVKAQYIMVMNPCHPLTTANMYNNVIRHFAQGDMTSLTSVSKKINIFFGQNECRINRGEENEVKTQNQPPIYEMAHAFHIFPRDRFLEDGVLWTYEPKDPFLYNITKIEALDIDDKYDFEICEAVFRTRS